MKNPETPVSMTYSISAVERSTGLGKDTLRVWERRYRFPLPRRDANGERVYSPEQVNKLRLLKRLIDHGHRPGKIIQFEIDELQKLNDGLLGVEGTSGISADRNDLQDYLNLCRAHQVEALRHALSQALMRMGLETFVVEVIAPLNRMVGEYWVRGLFAIHQEHLYTEVVQNLLRNAISAIVQPQEHSRLRPRVMLTTFPQEPHTLGLLMAEAFFALEGARCISLGVQTPIIDIVRAAEMQQADIVALSFSSLMNSRQALDGLAELGSALTSGTEIWAGGSNPALARPAAESESVRIITLSELPTALAVWRGRHSP